MSKSKLETEHKCKLADLPGLPLVRVWFWDHVTNETNPIQIEAVGKLLHHDKFKTIIVSWLPLNEDESTTKSNWEIFSLVTSCITEMRELKPGKKMRVRQ